MKKIVVSTILSVSVVLISCTSNPVKQNNKGPVNEITYSSSNENPKNSNEILAPDKQYYKNGCLVKCWDADHGNPLTGTWADWKFQYTDQWGGRNYQCSDLGAACIEYSWRAVYCGIISSDDNPTPGNTCTASYIQTLMSQAGQTFTGNLDDWNYEEIYVQPNYQFPVGTSQINIDFVKAVDY